VLKLSRRTDRREHVRRLTRRDTEGDPCMAAGKNPASRHYGHAQAGPAANRAPLLWVLEAGADDNASSGLYGTRTSRSITTLIGGLNMPR
jgi:hypothetical protein